MELSINAPLGVDEYPVKVIDEHGDEAAQFTIQEALLLRKLLNYAYDNGELEKE